MQTFLELLYYAAAAWYVAFVVTSTHGPFGIFERVREFKGGRWHGRTEGDKIYYTNPVTKEVSVTAIKADKPGLLDCIICLSIWVALLLRLVGANIVTDAFAIAGIALWFHSFTGWYHHGKA